MLKSRLTSDANRLSNAPSAPPPGHSLHQLRDSAVALERVVSPHHLSVVFQPIVSISSGRLFAYEQLVRCSLPEYASPPQLLEYASRSHCIGRLGRMIREIAIPLCEDYPLFVNVHPQELSEGWLVRPDDPIFSHSHDIYLEITESAPMTHFDLCLTVLREVHDRGGIHLVVDDLGAGYSNLKRIADLKPAVVKLDRELVLGIDTNDRQRLLVRDVVRLCHDLSARVVAEGIETHNEYSALEDLGVDYAQGYYLGRPSYPLPPAGLPIARAPEVPGDLHRKHPAARDLERNGNTTNDSVPPP